MTAREKAVREIKSITGFAAPELWDFKFELMLEAFEAGLRKEIEAENGRADTKSQLQ